LVELNKFKKDKPCPCLEGEINNPNLKLKEVQDKIQSLGYQQNTDLLLIGDIKNQTLSLTSTNGTIIYEIGMWK
jgi:hypothetical protein